MPDEQIRAWFEEVERQVNAGLKQARAALEELAGKASHRSREEGPLESLLQLKKMRDLDLITEQEYQDKKSEILKRL